MATIGTNLGLTYAWSLGENNWKTGMDANLKALDMLVQPTIKDFLTSPPGSPTTGDTYLTGNGCTGAWSGHDQQIARWNGAAWEFTTPKTGWNARRNTDAKVYTKEASGWQSSLLADDVFGLNSVTIAGAYQLASSGDSALLISGGSGAAVDVKLISTARFRWHTDLYLSRSTANTLRISSNGSTGAANLDVRGAATIGTNLTVSGLTSGRIPYASTAGLISDSSELTWDNAGVVLKVGSGASAAFAGINGAAGSNRDLFFQTNGNSRWTMRANSTTETGTGNSGSNLDLIARDDAGNAIDTPLSITRASAGVITIGGSSARRVDLTGALSFSGTTRITNAGAATFTGLTISGATAGRIPLVTTSGAITDSADHLWGTGAAGITLGRGSGSAARYLVLDHGTATASGIGWKKGGTDYWYLATTGANDDLRFEAYNSGTLTDSPLTIVRAAGGAATWVRPVVNSSAIRWTPATRTGSATTGANDIYVRYTGTGGHTETLPAATGTGTVLFFDHAGSGVWTISRAGSDTIDGGTTLTPTAGTGKVRLIDAASGVWRTI